MQSCVLCQKEMWRGKSHAHTLSSIASPLFAVQSVSLFHSINRNAISIQCSFFCCISMRVFQSCSSSCVSHSHFPHTINDISAHSTHFLFHKCSSKDSLVDMIQILFCAPFFFSFDFPACVCVLLAVDGDSSGTHMHWMRTRHHLSDNSLNYIIVIYSVRTSSAILSVSLRFFFRSFSFFRFRSQNQKRKREGRKKRNWIARHTEVNESATRLEISNRKQTCPPPNDLFAIEIELFGLLIDGRFRACVVADTRKWLSQSPHIINIWIIHFANRASNALTCTKGSIIDVNCHQVLARKQITW